MGLDMYLNAKRYIWSTETELADQVGKLFPELQGKRVKEIVVEAMYWRKSNQIHAWFVKNCQSGVDDCKAYYVSRKSLEELRDLILKVLAEDNADLLPPQSGFFFGSDQVDPDYWDDLRTTAEHLEKILTDFSDDWEFEYQSSW
jgi:hypothetical protein